ncbi:hypothetical protein [Campylobacter sp.]|uniref:hypothetical protein n=1 Tax=Campylobacter sp. TaxID=205 RepID=UPI002AA6C7FB|nr:hypothetical protein [Campylobacter sp.]MCI7447576.1 hypothetical protein [Campylobacter sp.]
MSKIMDDITNPNLEFHKQKLAEILKRDARGEAKYLSLEEFKAKMEERKQKLLKKLDEEKQASGQ